jgi:hypothetical protein
MWSERISWTFQGSRSSEEDRNASGSITVSAAPAATVVATAATAAVTTSTTATAAAAAIATAAAAATATTTAESAAARTGFARLGFIDRQSTALKFTIMQRFDRRGGFFVAVHFDEAESTAASCFPVLEDLSGDHTPVLGEQLVEIGTRCPEGQVSDV